MTITKAEQESSLRWDPEERVLHLETAYSTEAGSGPAGISSRGSWQHPSEPCMWQACSIPGGASGPEAGGSRSWPATEAVALRSGIASLTRQGQEEPKRRDWTSDAAD
jgi:hypothetical protein